MLLVIDVRQRPRWTCRLCAHLAGARVDVRPVLRGDRMSIATLLAGLRSAAVDAHRGRDRPLRADHHRWRYDERWRRPGGRAQIMRPSSRRLKARPCPRSRPRARSSSAPRSWGRPGGLAVPTTPSGDVFVRLEGVVDFGTGHPLLLHQGYATIKTHHNVGGLPVQVVLGNSASALVGPSSVGGARYRLVYQHRGQTHSAESAPCAAACGADRI
jgi:hypothetical protein